MLAAVAELVAGLGTDARLEAHHRRRRHARVPAAGPGPHPEREPRSASTIEPLDKDLAAGARAPGRLANDAKCFVLSEAVDGAAAPPAELDRSRPDVVFGATLGTGVGGGIVVDGRVLTGENGSATEWSHTTLPFMRPRRDLALPLLLRPPALHRIVHLGPGPRGRPTARWAAASCAARTIGQRADAGDDIAGDAPSPLYEDRLARALASVINLIDPRVIVLGGGVSNNARIFTNVPKLLERHTVAQGLRTKLVHAAHGDASGVRGAAWLWPG